MLVSFEGVSKSGKSTVLDEVRELKPEWLIYKGASLIEVDDWDAHVHVALRHFNELAKQNPENVIIVDRLFSDAVMEPDPRQSHNMRRKLMCMSAHVVYIGASEDELLTRGTRDAWHLGSVLRRYEQVLDILPSARFDTTEDDADYIARLVVSQIEQWNEA